MVMQIMDVLMKYRVTGNGQLKEQGGYLHLEFDTSFRSTLSAKGYLMIFTAPPQKKAS